MSIIFYDHQFTCPFNGKFIQYMYIKILNKYNEILNIKFSHLFQDYRISEFVFKIIKFVFKIFVFKCEYIQNKF